MLKVMSATRTIFMANIDLGGNIQSFTIVT